MNETTRTRRGNSVIYGALYTLPHYDFYIQNLDAYHSCSRYVLGQNHVLDIQHRISMQATPIFFSSVEELERLRYREGGVIDCEGYVANLNRPETNRHLRNTRSQRIPDGVLSEAMLAQIREEQR